MHEVLRRGEGESTCEHNDRRHDEHLGEPISPVNETELPWLVIPQAGAHQHRDREPPPDPKSKTQCASQTIYRELLDETREHVCNCNLPNKLHQGLPRSDIRIRCDRHVLTTQCDPLLAEQQWAIPN